MTKFWQLNHAAALIFFQLADWIDTSLEGLLRKMLPSFTYALTWCWIGWTNPLAVAHFVLQYCTAFYLMLKLLVHVQLLADRPLVRPLTLCTNVFMTVMAMVLLFRACWNLLPNWRDRTELSLALALGCLLSIAASGTFVDISYHRCLADTLGNYRQFLESQHLDSLYEDFLCRDAGYRFVIGFI
ncbi:hypothetical protein ACN47E_006255 [Coniothyrium glycines]